MRVEQELRQKGVGEAIAREALREAFDEDRGRAKVRALLKKRFRGLDLEDEKIVRRAAAFLERRGYPDSDIAEILKGAMGISKALPK